MSVFDFIHVFTLISLTFTFIQLVSSEDGFSAGAVLRGYQGNVDKTKDFSQALLFVTINQPQGPSHPVSVGVRVSGLPVGKYGLHIHTFGDMLSVLDENFQATRSISTATPSTAQQGEALGPGSHFNPDQTQHACPDVSVRHVGDLGNIEIATTTAPNEFITLPLIVPSSPLIDLSSTAHTVIGRMLILHSGTDDCVTQPTGNARTPIAQGVIGILNPQNADLPLNGNNKADVFVSEPINSMAAALFNVQQPFSSTITGFIRIQYIDSVGVVQLTGRVTQLQPNSKHALVFYQYGDEFQTQAAATGPAIFRASTAQADDSGLMKFSITYKSTQDFKLVLGRIFAVLASDDLQSEKLHAGVIGLSQVKGQISKQQPTHKNSILLTTLTLLITSLLTT